MLKQLWDYTKKILKSQEGRFDIAQFFGLKKKRADISPIMRAPLPPASLTEFPTGASLNEIILAGLKGKGVGFDPTFVSKTTSPIATARKARFEEEELPAIEEAMSARGLGRSTIATEGMRKGRLEMGRDIDQIIAEAYRTGEIQKKLDEARFQQMAGAFAGQEAGLATTRAGELTRRAGIEVGAGQAADLATQQNINRLIASAASVGTGQSGGMIDIYGGQPTSPTDYNLMREAVKASEASPFTVKQMPFQGAYDWLKRLGTTRRVSPTSA